MSRAYRKRAISVAVAALLVLFLWQSIGEDVDVAVPERHSSVVEEREAAGVGRERLAAVTPGQNADQRIDRVDIDLSRIHWRPLFNHTDDSDYPPDYDDLSARAEGGDTNAAFFLWQSLQYCDRAGPPPMTEEEIAEELRLIRDEHQVPKYVYGERQVVDIATLNTSTESEVMLAQGRFDRCNRMPLERRSEADYWKNFASLNGNMAAARVIAFELLQEGDPSAYRELWSQGDAMALNSLSGFFRDQYDAREDPAGLVKSYAYWLAFRELHYASREAAGPEMRSFFAGIERTTDEMRRELLPGQIAEAKEIAADILKDRPADCCISLDVPKERPN